MLPALTALSLAVGLAQTSDLAQKSEQARQLLVTGKYEAAIAIYTQLVRALPQETGLLLNLALAQHMAGHEAESIPNFEAVLKVQPGAEPALISLGAAHLALGQPRQALAPLKRAVAVEPGNLDARGLLAGACMDVGSFEEAADHYRRLTSASPDDPRLWYGLGMSYQSIATTALKRIQEADAQSPYLAALVARTRFQRRQYRSAFFFYHEALKQLPGLPGIHGGLAEIYRKTGHSEWAAEEEANEQALPPTDCSVHPSECQFRTGKDLDALKLPRTPKASTEALYWQAKAANELALQAFFRLGQLPPSVELHQLRAEIARDQNQPMEAVTEWRAALELAPNDPRLQEQLAASLLIAGDYRAAVDQAVATLKAVPAGAELNFVAGDSLLHLEEPEKSIPYLRAALGADPKLLPAAASLGLALSRLDRSTEAIQYLAKALDLDDDGSLHYQLAQAYQATGNPQKARATMAAYQALLKKSRELKEEVAREAQIEPPR
ncbi:MAG TPA: tetratricopeptide repeat protein [Bryobacteraceae bacterium]|nr:tetratricopeptide repeat protein [Bryobacteraceae bacterium]